MNLSEISERMQGWRVPARTPRAWQGLLALSLLLLAADMIGLGGFLRHLGGRLGGPAGQSPGWFAATLFAASLTLTLAAGQIGYWALHTGRVERFAGRNIFVAFVAVGAALNVAGNFLYLTAGQPTAENLQTAIGDAAATPWGVLFLVIYALLALLLSLLPEYLLVLAFNLRREE